jgi:hypothetical protein
VLKPLTSSLSPSEKSKGARCNSTKNNKKINKKTKIKKLIKKLIDISLKKNIKKNNKKIKIISKPRELITIRTSPKKLNFDLLKKEPTNIKKTNKPIKKITIIITIFQFKKI